MKITFIYQPYESIGIETISALLRSKGHEVNLLVEYDFFNDGFLDIPKLHNAFHFQENIIKQVKETKPDLIAFSVVTDYYHWAKNFAQKIKKETGLPIIFGGIHPTILPELVLKNSFVDIVCQGEGELAMLELADKFDKTGKVNAENIKNLWYKKNGRLVKNELRDLVENLDRLPFADKEIFYQNLPRLKREYWIMTSRGCPYSCSYCWNCSYRNLYKGKGKYLRRRSVEDVIEELMEGKKKWNYERICFLDDLFTFDRNWLKEFTKKIKKTELFGIPYSCTGHPKFINKDIVKLLKETKCDEVELGVQTASENTRKNVVFRPETNEDVINSSKLIKEAGMSLFLDHIAALPYEGEKEQIEAVKLYNKVRPTYVSFFWLRHYPGTEIQQIALKNKEISKKHIKMMEEGEALYDPYGFYGKRAEEFIPFEYLIGLLTILPPKLVDWMIESKFYQRFRKPSLILGQGISRIFVSLLRRDFRLISSFLRRYKDMFFYLRKRYFSRQVI